MAENTQKVVQSKPDKKAEKKPGFFAKVKGFFGRIGKFFRDTKSELKKVVWPSRKDTKNNTIVVLVVVIVAAIVLIALDALFGGIMKWIITGSFM